MICLEKFHALKTGKVPFEIYDLSDDSVKTVETTVKSFVIGNLNLPSGKLGISDPYTDMNLLPLLYIVPPGNYPVSITLANVSPEQNDSNISYKEAYLSVILREGEIYSVEPAVADEEDGRLSWDIAVNSGTAGFFDYETALKLFNESSMREIAYLLDKNINIVDKAIFGIFNPEKLPGNFVYSQASDVYGVYPVLQTKDKEGNIIGYHIDFKVLNIS